MLLSISPITLAHEISQARQHVYYSGAGIDKEVSDALITLKQINPSIEVIVVSDCSSHARRLGYGNQESLKNLQQHKIPVFEQQGVRLSFCLIDHSGWVFSFPPQLVESVEPSAGFNCIQLDTNQTVPLINQIRSLIEPDVAKDHKANDKNSDQPDIFDIQLSSTSEKNLTEVQNVANKDSSTEGISKTDELKLKPFTFVATAKKLTDETLKKLDQELEQNPPQHFNVSRQVQVFNSRVEFVEVELVGGYIDRHVFKFPDEIKKLISDDAEAQKRLSASYKLIDSTSKLSSKTISADVDSLRRKFLKPIGKLGRVMLRTNKEEFKKEFSLLEKKIEVYKKELDKSLKSELDKSKKALISALTDRVKANPPDELKFGIETKNVTKAQANDYLNRLLEKYMPTPEELLGAIVLKHHFKAVTYEMLSDQEFQKQLKQQFPLVPWVMPMEEYTAAKGEQVENTDLFESKGL